MKWGKQAQPNHKGKLCLQNIARLGKQRSAQVVEDLWLCSVKHALFFPSFLINYPAHSLCLSLLLLTPAAKKPVVFTLSARCLEALHVVGAQKSWELGNSFAKTWEAPHLSSSALHTCTWAHVHAHTHQPTSYLPNLSSPAEWAGLEAGLAVLSCVSETQ